MKPLIWRSGKVCQKSAMIKQLGLLACFAALTAGADAQQVSCGNGSDLPALLRCAHGAILVLPADKQERLADDLHEVTQMVEQNTSRRFSAHPPMPDFGWEAARPSLIRGGIDELVATARAKEGRLRYGRAEALLAAGLRAEGFEQTDELARTLSGQPDTARRLNDELLSLARSGNEWERGDLAHAAASLAARRCDLARFDQAMTMVMARDALRYKFWRARITGDRSGLPGAIMQGANDDDTSHARQALEGLTLLAELGDCAS